MSSGIATPPQIHAVNAGRCLAADSVGRLHRSASAANATPGQDDRHRHRTGRSGHRRSGLSACGRPDRSLDGRRRTGSLGTVLALVRLWSLRPAPTSSCRLLPPLLHRINPIFAAATIEKSQPTLKNSLINFLLLRGRRQEVAAPFYRAMESRAAADLSNVEIEVAVDRTHSGSPGLRSVGHRGVVQPLSGRVAEESRCARPRESSSLVDDRSADASDDSRRAARHCARASTANRSPSRPMSTGLRDGRAAPLIYSTSDGQIVDQEIPMTRTEDGLRYECRFPPGNLGLQQDCEYYLAGGDCQTPSLSHHRADRPGHRHRLDRLPLSRLHRHRRSHRPASKAICGRSRGPKSRCMPRPTPKSSRVRPKSTSDAPAASGVRMTVERQDRHGPLHAAADGRRSFASQPRLLPDSLHRPSGPRESAADPAPHRRDPRPCRRRSNWSSRRKQKHRWPRTESWRSRCGRRIPISPCAA